MTILFIILLIAIVKTKDIIDVRVIISGTFLACVFLDYLYATKWKLPLSLEASFVILLGIALFCIGATMGSRFIGGANNGISFGNVVNIKELSYNKQLLIVFIIGGLICLGLNVRDFYQLSSQVTTETGLGSRISALVSNMQFGKISFSRWYAYRMVFLQSIGYVSLFLFAYNCIHKKYVAINNILLVPVLIYIVSIVFTGGRQSFIYFVIFGIVTSSFEICRKYNWTTKGTKVVVYIYAGFLAFFLLLFVSMGILGHKIASPLDTLRVLGHYAGTNISAFDVFLHRDYPDTQYLGTMTLTGVYAKLQSYGYPAPVSYIKEFTAFDGITTNVYTAFRRYIQDYGFVGFSFIMLILGLWYSSWYQYLKRVSYSSLGLIIYATYVFPVFLFCREERFMTGTVNTTTLYMILCMYILYKLLVTEKEVPHDK